MSECNYCVLKQIRKQAKDAGKKVTVKPSGYSLGGKDIYVHPADVLTEALTPDTENHKNYFVAWLMEIPKRCKC